MAKLRDLPIEPRLAHRWFAEARLRTSDDLWRELGRHLGQGGKTAREIDRDLKRGLRAVRNETSITPDVVRRALLAANAAEARSTVTRFDLLLGAALLTLLTLASFRIAEALHLASFPLPGLSATCDQAVVVPRAGLPAFHMLTESDLRSEARPRTLNGVAAKSAVGRYLLHPLAADAVVREDDLASIKLVPGALAGRRTATLKADPITLGAQVVPGAQALVVLLPPGPGAKAAEAEATILAVDRKTGQVAVAFIAPPRPEILGALGAPASFLVQAGAPPQTAAAKP